MQRKKGKPWKESWTVLLCCPSDKKLLHFHTYLMGLWRNIEEQPWLSKGAHAAVKESTLIPDIGTFKIESNSNHLKLLKMAPKHRTLHIFIHYKIFCMRKKKKNLLRTTTFGKRQFHEGAYKMTTCTRSSFLSVPNNGCLLHVWL